MPCANLSLACIKMQLQHVGISCIKRVGGFPKKIMVRVATLGIRRCPLHISFVNVEIKIRLMIHILEHALTETKMIINLFIMPLLTKNTLNTII